MSLTNPKHVFPTRWVFGEKGWGVRGHSVSLSDSLCRRVWGRVVGVRSRRAVVHLQTLFGKETPLKIAPQSEETTPGDDFWEITQRNDCATR